MRLFVRFKLPGALAAVSAGECAMYETLYKRWSPTWQYTADDEKEVKQAFAEPGCLSAALGYDRAAAFTIPRFLRARVPVPSLAIAGGDDPGVGPEVSEALSIFRGLRGGHDSPRRFLSSRVALAVCRGRQRVSEESRVNLELFRPNQPGAQRGAEHSRGTRFKGNSGDRPWCPSCHSGHLPRRLDPRHTYWPCPRSSALNL